MQNTNIRRRDFLKEMSGALTGAGALVLFSPVQSAFASRLTELPVAPENDSSFTELRKEYLLSPEITYFNHGSIGTIPKMVHEAHKSYLELCETNPWLYVWSEPWQEALAQTRKKAARFLQCDPDEIAFTHNTTEGFNLLANGLPLAKGDEVVFSSMNHAGASQCWFHYAETKGFSVKKFDFPIRDVPGLSADDIVNIYARHISEKTRVLVIPHVDNLVGIRYPVKEMAAMARSKGVRFVAVDGAQSVGMFPLSLTKLGVDFFATSPHKWLQAPKGTGLLYLRKDAQPFLRPMWVTWGQKRWKGTARVFEDYGTRNLAEVLTLGDAMDFQEHLGIKASDERRQFLWKYFRDAVDSKPQISWRSPKSWELGSSLYTIEVSRNSRELFQELFKSHGFVFRAFHGPDWNTIRVSPNVFNTTEEMDRFFELLG